MSIVFPLPLGVKATWCGAWHDPRPNGRVHEGIDLCAPAGTPILAPVDGLLKFGNDPLGGRVVTIADSATSHWYVAHLSAWEGSAPRQVAAGDVVGYVGSSGDASAALPHAHVGHYVNGSAVDPTADIRGATKIPIARVVPAPTPTSDAMAIGMIVGTLVGLGATLYLIRARPWRKR